MTRWSEIAPVDPVKVETARSARRRAVSIAGSIVAHAMLLIAVWSAQSGLLSSPEKIEPDVPLLFMEPTSPPPVPRPQILLPRLKAPKPPPPAPAPAPRDDQRPLLGWKSQGDKPGTPERPPGPLGRTLIPGAPDEGKGRKDGESGAGAEPAKSPTPPPEAEEQRARDHPEPSDGLFGESARRDPSKLERAAQTSPPSKWPGSRTDGRRGRPGAGDDFNVGVGGRAFGDITFESGDFDWSDYSSKVYYAVYYAWLREMHGRITRFERDQLLRHLPGLDGETAIRFVLRRDGSVDALEVLQPSPIPALDESASAALRRAVLPPLPADFPRTSERVVFRFILSGFETAQQLQRDLDYSLARGEF